MLAKLFHDSGTLHDGLLCSVATITFSVSHYTKINSAHAAKSSINSYELQEYTQYIALRFLCIT